MRAPLQDERPFLSPRETYFWAGAISALVSSLVGVVIALTMAADASNKAYQTGLSLCDLQNDTRTLVNGLVNRANRFIENPDRRFDSLPIIRCLSQSVIRKP